MASWTSLQNAVAAAFRQPTLLTNPWIPHVWIQPRFAMDAIRAFGVRSAEKPD
jgi:hypothetical protein